MRHIRKLEKDKERGEEREKVEEEKMRTPYVQVKLVLG